MLRLFLLVLLLIITLQTFTHKNIPNVIAKFTEALSSVNISDMINKSKGELAYTIINTDHAIPAEAIEKLNQIDAVIRVRVIK